MVEVEPMKCEYPKVINGMVVPCGKCVACRRKRINDWYIRMLEEAKAIGFNECSFVTLTYRSEDLPSPESGGVLVKADYQKFLKRLRMRLIRAGYSAQFRYFMCGEYGSKNGRPHFHFIFFGVPKCLRNYIESAWDKGFIDCQSASRSSFRYVAKYCVKSFNNEKVDVNTGEVCPEFVSMSRRGGLGLAAISSAEASLLLLSQDVIKDTKYVYAIPRFFRVKIKEKYGFRKVRDKLKVYYNEFVFTNQLEIIKGFANHLDVYRRYCNCIEEFIGEFPHSNYSTWDFIEKNVEFISFKDLTNNVLVNRQLSRDYFIRRGKDYELYNQVISSKYNLTSINNYVYDRYDYLITFG